MKTFLLSLLFTPLLACGQKLALLDRNFQQPINLVDTITLEEATKGASPIYFKDIDQIINSMQGLVKYMTTGKLHKEESFDLVSGNTKCIVKTQRKGSTGRYNIVLNTNTGKFKTFIVLVSDEANKRAVQRLTIFLDYLKNNVSIISGKL